MGIRAWVGSTLLLLLAGPAAAYDFPSCREEGYLASFGVTYGAQSCRTVVTTQIRWRGGHAPLRLIVPEVDTPTLNERETELVRDVEQLAARIGRGMNAMGEVELQPVTILLSHVDVGGFHALTHSTGPECKVLFLKLPGPAPGVSEEKFLFTLSHEIFHCIQGRSWRTQYLADGRAPLEETGTRPGDWWIEGSAEYFALLVNPGSTESDGYFSRFDQTAEDQPLPDMDYPAVVLFLWLHQRSEAPGVRRFLDGMATTAGTDAQRAALRSRVPMEDWLDFGQTYLEGRLRQPGGRTPTWLISSGEQVVFDRPRSHTSYATEFALARETFVFRQGRTYTLAVEDVDGEPRSRFNLGPGEWMDPPSLVRACDEDVSHLVLTTAIEGEVPSLTFRVDQSERLDERACCLVGDWAPTPASRQAELALLMGTASPALSVHGASMSCRDNGGDWRLRFTADATGQVDWQGFSYRCDVSGPTGGMGNTMTRMGSTDFTWTVLDRQVGVAQYTGSSLHWNHIMHLGPMEKSRVLADAGPSTASNNFAFQCSDTSLSVQGIYGLNAGQGTYTRVGAPPAAPRP